jgi:hypothetical protein
MRPEPVAALVAGAKVLAEPRITPFKSRNACLEGPAGLQLIFRQEHPPGEQALSDFTDASSLAVTIDGGPFPHLLYHFWLAFSGWQ